MAGSTFVRARAMIVSISSSAILASASSRQDDVVGPPMASTSPPLGPSATSLESPVVFTAAMGSGASAAAFGLWSADSCSSGIGVSPAGSCWTGEAVSMRT
jgi:hypothetical protein